VFREELLEGRGCSCSVNKPWKRDKYSYLQPESRYSSRQQRSASFGRGSRDSSVSSD